ncbi:hypothetical protein M413DRAFT_11328 [Hebeloma cylindrosporum]|uniref:Uncharacterized protein n=1 Tax=Hebeloma cylindrosporum TaxID=76867 RepID=A0A0C2YJG0_HEBCY|nr:hypothetical protein M413DRAFT_11328 [Hebeloma cylindrosporum h7]
MSGELAEPMMDMQYFTRGPTLEDFASILGFQDASSNPRFANLSEDSKTITISTLQSNFYTMLGPTQQNLVSYKFSALYLPELVKRIHNPPGFLKRHTPYLAKYFRSQDPIAEEGKSLMPVLAERLIRVAPRLEVAMASNPDYEESAFFASLVGSSVEILGDLLNIFIKEPKGSPILLPQATKKALIPCLKKWEIIFSAASVDPTLGGMCRRTRNLLEGNALQISAANRLRKVLKNWEHCGNPGYVKPFDM